MAHAHTHTQILINMKTAKAPLRKHRKFHFQWSWTYHVVWSSTKSNTIDTCISHSHFDSITIRQSTDYSSREIKERDRKGKSECACVCVLINFSQNIRDIQIILKHIANCTFIFNRFQGWTFKTIKWLRNHFTWNQIYTNVCTNVDNKTIRVMWQGTSSSKLFIRNHSWWYYINGQ